MVIVNLLVVLFPAAGVLATAILLWNGGVNWMHSAVFFAMMCITGVGITVGFHRMFTHRSFQTGKVLRAIFAIIGSMAVEGPLFDWVATHRMHHQHSDHSEDPHSPQLHGEGWRGLFSGLWHAHCGWLFDREPEGLERYVGDLRKESMLRWINSTFLLWVVVSLAIPTALGGLISMSWKGALLGLVWGGFARIFFVHHITWSINSVCHIWGSRDFESHDHSRNNWIFGVLAFGEGWHNNHHAFPTSARHGLRWWQIDVSYVLIVALNRLGLATKVRLPTNEAIAEKLRRRKDNLSEGPH